MNMILYNLFIMLVHILEKPFLLPYKIMWDAFFTFYLWPLCDETKTFVCCLHDHLLYTKPCMTAIHTSIQSTIYQDTNTTTYEVQMLWNLWLAFNIIHIHEIEA